MKASSPIEMKEIISSKDFSSTSSKWAIELEIIKPDEVENEQYVEFTNRNQDHFEQIEDFIHIVDDWID